MTDWVSGVYVTFGIVFLLLGLVSIVSNQSIGSIVGALVAFIAAIVFFSISSKPKPYVLPRTTRAYTAKSRPKVPSTRTRMPSKNDPGWITVCPNCSTEFPSKDSLCPNCGWKLLR